MCIYTYIRTFKKLTAVGMFLISKERWMILNTENNKWLKKHVSVRKLRWRFSSRTVTPNTLLKKHLGGLRKKQLNVLECPSQCSDLNPTENLWFDLKIAGHKQCLFNLKELEQL